MFKKLAFYMLRWQMSTPILAGVIWLLSGMNPLLITIIANGIGSLIFFWVDRMIFRNVSKTPLWEIKKEVMCNDCGHIGYGYRIVEWRGYNRRVVKNPQFRCEKCSHKKFEEVKKQVNINK